MSEKNSENGGELKTEQMNVRVSEETKEIVRREAESRYGSTKKMGQTLNEIVSEWAGTDNAKVLDKLDSLEEMLQGSASENTHTTKSSKTTGVDEDLLEAIEDGEVDPEEYDLSQLKGEDATLVRDGIIAVLRHDGEQTYTKKEVQTLIESEVGYSVNAARNKRDLVLREMVDVSPDIRTELEQALRDEFDAELWYPVNGNSEWYVSRDLDSPQHTWVSKYSTSVQKYLGFELRGEGYALEEQADVVQDIQRSQLSANEETALDDRDLHKVFRIQTVAIALGYMDSRTVSVEQI